MARYFWGPRTCTTTTNSESDGGSPRAGLSKNELIFGESIELVEPNDFKYLPAFVFG